MDSRVLTFCAGFLASGRKVPTIRIQGVRVQGMGFKIGSKITVEGSNGQMVLKLVEVKEAVPEPKTRTKKSKSI